MDFHDNIRRALNVIHDTAALPINYLFPSSTTDNIRISGMSDDVLPSSPPIETSADSTSSDESSLELEDDDLSDHEIQDNNINPSNLNKVETLHTSVINQMKKEGLFKQLESIKENQKGYRENESDRENDGDVEDEVIMRPEIPPHRAYDKYPDVTGPEKERLIIMETLFAEIGLKEEHFVKILSLMVRKYPEYLKTCKLKGNKSRSDTQYNEIVASIVRELEPVLQAHESLLNEIEVLSHPWDSRHPNLALTMLKNVDFLQICLPFLVKKRKLCQEFKLITDTDEEFAHATNQFEIQVMNNPEVHSHTKFGHMSYKPVESTVKSSSGVCFYQQLDMIHQNVVRYRLFMERYNKLLNFDNDEEIALTKQVLEKLDKILKSIDSKLDEPQSIAFLLQVHEKFQNTDFNVLTPGRHFVREGLILRQTRKDLVERKLILFTDALLICHLDYTKFWQIDLHKMQIIVEDSTERERWFLLYSTKKSTAVLCSTKSERDSWVQQILQTQNQLRSLNRKTESYDNNASNFCALWVADDETTMCMMADCTRKFNMIIRRHHCRKCGYIICGGCSGFALVPHGDHHPSRVCSHCYYELTEMMHNGTLKESSNILEISSHHIKFENGKEKAIKELFIPPKHGKKTRGDDYSNKDKYFVSGTIWTKNGSRFARLTTDYNLYLYAARYDPQPAEHYYLQGYSYTVTDSNKEGRVHFKLTQQTGSKSSVIDFYVNEKLSVEWENALDQLK